MLYIRTTFDPYPASPSSGMIKDKNVLIIGCNKTLSYPYPASFSSSVMEVRGLFKQSVAAAWQRKLTEGFIVLMLIIGEVAALIRACLKGWGPGLMVDQNCLNY